VEFRKREEAQIKGALKAHPTLLLIGPSTTGIFRARSAILEEHLDLSDPEQREEKESVLRGLHPDLRVADGRNLKAADAREIRVNATTNPIRWMRKYLLLSHIDRLHSVAIQVLLKVIEEPPARFAIVMTTNNLTAIPGTIPSRSIQIRIKNPSFSELETYLVDKGVEEPAWRAQACGGDPDIADDLDERVTRNWHKLWSAIAAGGRIPTDFPVIWANELMEANEATQISCWELLIQVASKLTGESRYWRDIAYEATETRNGARGGYLAKISTGTALVRVYALAKTIAVRGA